MTSPPPGTTGGMRLCGECGREMEIACKVHAGTAICRNCYQRLFKRRNCVKCNGPVRAMSQDPAPTCPSCRRAERVCLRCERPVPRAELIFKGKPVCPSCAPYYRAARPCSRCGKSSTRLSRIVGVTDGKVCNACRRQLLCATCSVCGKHRERFALTNEGKPLCKKCASNPEANHACPDCGKMIGGAGNAPCLPCRMIRSFRKKADALSDMLHHPETRRLLERYVEWAITRQSTNMAVGPLPKVVVLLEKIERQLPDGAQILPAMILEALTTEEIRRAGLFAMFLAERGLMPSSSGERAAASDSRRIEAALSEIRGKPWETEIREYAAELGAPERKLAARTRRIYLRAAVELMAFSDAKGLRELTDEHIRRFLRSKPGHRASIFPWLSFAREKTNRKLSVPKKKARKEPTIGSVAESVSYLVEAVRNALTMEARRALLAKLLSVLYDVPLEQVVDMARADLDIASEATRLRFGNDWVIVEKSVDDLMSYLIDASQSEAASTKLFPGRLKVDGLSVGAVQYHLARSAIRSKLSV